MPVLHRLCSHPWRVYGAASSPCFVGGSHSCGIGAVGGIVEGHHFHHFAQAVHHTFAVMFAQLILLAFLALRELVVMIVNFWRA